MQSLIALLLQLAGKTWTSILVIVLSCGAVTLFYFSASNAAGSNSTPGTRAVVVQMGPTGHAGGTLCAAHGGGSVPVVPEANPGLVLIPIMAVVLFFSTRRLALAKPFSGTGGASER